MSVLRRAKRGLEWRRLHEVRETIFADWSERWRINSPDQAREVLLDPEQPLDRRCAAAVLATAGPAEAAVAALVDMISSEADLAWCVANALGGLKSFKATRPLMRMVRETESSINRNAAIYALGLIGDRRAFPLLIQVLRSSEEPDETRAIAADELGTWADDEKVLKALLATHNDASSEVRFSVINSIQRKVHDPRVALVLKLHLDDQIQLPGRPSVAELARQALKP